MRSYLTIFFLIPILIIPLSAGEKNWQGVGFGINALTFPVTKVVTIFPHFNTGFIKSPFIFYFQVSLPVDQRGFGWEKMGFVVSVNVAVFK